ncbi:MAG TPA: hypothetical protein VLW05_00675 [Gaiellaceae bacterium]|nr:hypothetical protein [Gaiellaceae bacterium]
MVGRAGRGALVATVAAVAAGCGGSHESAQQKALTAYVQQVNSVDKSMVVAVERVNAAYLRFRGGKRMPSVQQLRAAERTILTIRDRIESIAPPPLAASVLPRRRPCSSATPRAAAPSLRACAG